MLPVAAKRNQCVCLTLEFLWSLYLGTSFINLYFESYGLSQTQIFGLQVVITVVKFTTDVPLGYVADRFGVRRVIVAGTVVQVIQTFYFLTCTSFWQFAFCYLLNGLFLSALSNTTSTIMTRSLAVLEDKAVRSAAYATYEKRRVDVRNFGFLASAVIGGSLVAVGTIAWPFWVQPIIFAAGVITSFGLDRLPEQNSGHRYVYIPLRKTIHTMLSSKPDIQLVILLSTIVRMGGFVCLWLLQPRMQLTGMPAWTFALVYLGRSMIVIVLQRVDLGARVDARTMWVMLTLCMPIGALAAALTTGYIGLMVLVAAHAFISAFSDVLTWTYLYNVLPNDYRTRTTELSIVTTVESLSFMIIGPVAGWMKDAYSLSAAFLMIGTVGLCLGIPVLLIFRRHAHL